MPYEILCIFGQAGTYAKKSQFIVGKQHRCRVIPILSSVHMTGDNIFSFHPTLHLNYARPETWPFQPTASIFIPVGYHRRRLFANFEIERRNTIIDSRRANFQIQNVTDTHLSRGSIKFLFAQWESPAKFREQFRNSRAIFIHDNPRRVSVTIHGVKMRFLSDFCTAKLGNGSNSDLNSVSGPKMSLDYPCLTPCTVTSKQLDQRRINGMQAPNL